jgi:hypothetical protein
VGSDSIRVDLNFPSLDVQSGTSAGVAVLDDDLFSATVLHKMEHALGFQHEHQSPESNCDAEFNWQIIYPNYLQRYGWDKSKVDANLPALVRSPRLRMTAYDRRSIMHYYCAEWMFTNGRASSCFVPHNTTLSLLDRGSISAAYPKDPRKQLELVKDREQNARQILKDLALSEDQKKMIEEKITQAVSTISNGISISGISCSTSRNEFNRSARRKPQY